MADEVEGHFTTSRNRKLRRHVLVMTVVPFLGFLAAVVLLWRKAVEPVDILLLVSLWTVTGLAGTVGYHRLFAHRAFKTTPLIRMVLAAVAAMSAQGPVIYWVALHRKHHRFSDQPGDPHSPHLEGDSPRELLRGFWHAHIGWMYRHELPESPRYAADLLKDKAILKVNGLYPLWMALSLTIPIGLGALLHANPVEGAWHGFLWGSLARLFVGQHLIWSINSLCHFFGTRPFEVRDHSTNNTWLSLATMGESLHNNHHAFPSSARFGHRWWQLDPGAWLIGSLEALGLVWDVKKVQLEGSRRVPGPTLRRES